MTWHNVLKIEENAESDMKWGFSVHFLGISRQVLVLTYVEPNPLLINFTHSECRNHKYKAVEAQAA